MKKDYNLAGPHSKPSTALELIMVHLESSYAHSTFAWILGMEEAPSSNLGTSTITSYGKG